MFPWPGEADGRIFHKPESDEVFIGGLNMKRIIAITLTAIALASSAQAQYKSEPESVAYAQSCIHVLARRIGSYDLDGYCLGMILTIIHYENALKGSCYGKNEGSVQMWKTIFFQAIADSKETDNMIIALINASRKLYPCPGK